MSFEIDGSDFLSLLDLSEFAAAKGAEKGMQDSVDDLARISSEIAPLDSSALRKSVNKEVKWKYGSLVGEVTFSVTENSARYGRFNYALWTHEYEYNLGPLSKGGTDGYEVGNKYLSRPLEGESDKYLKWMEEEVQRMLG